MALNAAIERLRARMGDEPERISIETLQAVRDGVIASDAVDVVAANAGVEPAKVLDIVGDLGTWLSHYRSSAHADLSTDTEPGQMTMFSDALRPLIQLGDGFARQRGSRRDVTKAYAAVSMWAPSDIELARYLDRKYPAQVTTLTFGVVALVWRFATLGRLDEIDEIDAKNPWFPRLVVEAYDTLDIAIDATSAAIGTLCDPDAVIDDIRGALRRCGWLNHPRIARIERAADATVRSGDDRYVRRELRQFAIEVADHPDRFRIGHIGQLSEAHMRGICTAAGLTVVRSTANPEPEVRRRIAAAGQRADTDLLVPLGVRAADVGLLDEFVDALERRAGGDIHWADELNDALAATGVNA